MKFQAIFLIGIIIVLNGCFRVSSGTKIIISNVPQDKYILIKKNIKNIITKFNPPFDCDIDQKYWKLNRDSGELICLGEPLGEIYVDMNKKTVNIAYSGTYAFWFPTKEKITDEHKKIQQLFLQLASQYKKKYKKVEVIFYHRDLPREGKSLL